MHTNIPCNLISQEKYAVEGDLDAPRICTDEEAMFTAYQMTRVCFTGPTNLKAIKVSGIHMPQIKKIQDWVLRCNQSPIGLDLLVKGAVPVTVQVSATLHTAAGIDIDFTAMQGRVADYVNNIPFDGVLSISGLVALLHSMLPEGSYVSRPALFASQWLRVCA
jgi:hypothetical protein